MDLDSVPVWVVDDDDVRYSIQFALATLGRQAATYGSVDDFLDAVDLTQPGCLVMDADMKHHRAHALFDQLREENSPIQVIFFASDPTCEDAMDVLDRGAVALMRKPVYPDELAKKIQVAQSRALVALSRAEVLRKLESLSRRERQIFFLLARGMTSQDIADELFVSRRTVEVHRVHIARKLAPYTPVTVLYELARDSLARFGEETPVRDAERFVDDVPAL